MRKQVGLKLEAKTIGDLEYLTRTTGATRTEIIETAIKAHVAKALDGAPGTGSPFPTFETEKEANAWIKEAKAHHMSETKRLVEALFPRD